MTFTFLPPARSGSDVAWYLANYRPLERYVRAELWLLIRAATLAYVAAAAPRELVVKVKGTIGAVAAIDDHHEAVLRELDPQVWSVQQPAFAERLAAMQAKISRRS